MMNTIPDRAGLRHRYVTRPLQKNLLKWISILFVATLSTGTVHATTYFDNNTETPALSPLAETVGTTSGWIAQKFTTSVSLGNYWNELASAKFKICQATGTNVLALYLFTDNGGKPGIQLEVLTTSSSYLACGAAPNYSFQSATFNTNGLLPAFIVSPNASFWLVFKAAGGTFRVESTASISATPPGSNAWFDANSLRCTSIANCTAGTWVAVNTRLTQIDGTPKPCGKGVAVSLDTWQMLASPCGAENPTVQGGVGNDSVPGNFDPTSYGPTDTGWAMWKRNITSIDPLKGEYVKLDLSSDFLPGQGYWLKSAVAPLGDDKLTVTQGEDTAVSYTETGCASAAGGCYAVTVNTVSGQNRYNLVGNPFPVPIDWAQVRIQVDGTTVYTPSQAAGIGAGAANPPVLSNIISIWDGSNYTEYDDITPLMKGNLEYYTSFWVNVLPGANGHTVKLLIPAVRTTHSQGASLTNPAMEKLVYQKMPWYLGWVDWLIAPAAAESGNALGESGIRTAVPDKPGKPGPGKVPPAPGPVGQQVPIKGLAEREAALKAQAQALKTGQAWAVRIKVVNPATGWHDNNNALGQLLDSQDGYDFHDLPAMAPFATPYLTVVFPHADWGSKNGNYTSDYRSAQGLPSAMWNFEVRAQPLGSNVILSWEGDPKILALSTLTDNLTGKTIKPSDRRYARGYPITLTNASHSFTWRYLGAAKR